MLCRDDKSLKCHAGMCPETDTFFGTRFCVPDSHTILRIWARSCDDGQNASRNKCLRAPSGTDLELRKRFSRLGADGIRLNELGFLRLPRASKTNRVRPSLSRARPCLMGDPKTNGGVGMFCFSPKIRVRRQCRLEKRKRPTGWRRRFPGVTPKRAGLHQPAGRSKAVGRRSG